MLHPGQGLSLTKECFGSEMRYQALSGARAGAANMHAAAHPRATPRRTELQHPRSFFESHTFQFARPKNKT